MQKKNHWKVVLGILIVTVDIAALAAWVADTELLGLVTVGLPEIIGVSTLAALIFAWANWPSLKRLSPSVRFRELHALIDTELRVTRRELESGGALRRSDTGLGVDRTPLAFKLEELGIFSPHPQDQGTWMEFLLIMSTLSEHGYTKRARQAYGNPGLREKWEQGKIDITNWRDPFMSSEVARSSASVYLSLCRERMLSQENLNREYAVKATGVITFAATLFVLGIAWDDWDSMLLLTKGVIGVMGLCVLVIAATALSLIIRPRNWRPACELGKIEKDALEAHGHLHYMRIVMGAAASYRKAAEENKEILGTKASCLTLITWVAVAEMGILLALKFFQ